MSTFRRRATPLLLPSRLTHRAPSRRSRYSRPRATSSRTSATATACTAISATSTNSCTAPACTGEAPPSSMPTNAPGSVTEPHGPGLIEPRQQRVRRGRAGDLQPGVPVEQPERHPRLDLSVPQSPARPGPPPAEDGRGERAADEDAR